MSLPVRARFGGSVLRLMTTDIAADGLFVVTPGPPEPGELVHLTLVLPPGSEELEVRAMVVRVVTGEMALRKRAAAGVGVRFYGLGQGARARWLGFYSEAAARAKSPRARPARAAEAPPADEAKAAPEVLPRGAETRDDGDLGPPLLLYRIRPRDIEGVRLFRDTALEGGGLALVGIPPAPRGAVVVVAVVHPVTKAEFHVPAKIVQAGSGRRRTAVRFLGLTKRTRAEFDHFAQRGVQRKPDKARPGDRDPSLVESWEETQQDLQPGDEHAVHVDEILPLGATAEEPPRPRASPPRRR